MLCTKNIITGAITLAYQEWNFARAAIHRLPVEILAHCWSFLDNVADKVAASRVCTLWRRIVISSPSIWSTLNLCLAPPETYLLLLHGLHLFLRRAGNLPVRLTVRVSLQGRQIHIRLYRDASLPHPSS